MSQVLQQHGRAVSVPMPALAEVVGARRKRESMCTSNGGSALNFLSEPMKPDTVAKAVVDSVDRPRLETSVPRHDGWLVKVLGLTPAVLQHIRPALERAAQSGVEKYRRSTGIP